MKKLLSTALTLILATTMFTACAPSDPAPKTANKAIIEYTTEGKETKLVGDPNATGELTVNLLGIYYEEENSIIEKMYKELYPNVKLTLINERGDISHFPERVKKLQTEIMAGTGPDVFIAAGEAADPYKTMKSGVCADLTPYFENDKNFNINDFNKAIFCSGQMNGKQYMVPTSYYIPLFITTQAIVDETKLDLAKCKDYFSTADELARVLKENTPNCSQDVIFHGLNSACKILELGGFPWIDYDKNIANINSPEMERAYGILKDSFFDLSVNKEGGSKSSNFMPASSLNKKQTMISEITSDQLEKIVMNGRALTALDDTPVIFPWRNFTGGITATAFNGLAVRYNSNNMQNAYNFIKLMISEELNSSQFMIDDLNALQSEGDIPINNKVVEKFFETYKGKEGDKDGFFAAGTPYKFEYVPDDLIEQYKGFLSEIDNVSLGPEISITMRGIMQPFLEGEKTYEECIEKAQDHLEIYITE